MTEAIRNYINSLSKEKLWNCLHEGDALYMPKKNDHPLHTEKNVATFYLVGYIDEIETEEDGLNIKNKVTITAIEFWDWGILPETDEEDEDDELSEEQIQEVVADSITEILDIEVEDYKHAYYNSFRGLNLYRAPLKKPIVLLRTAPLLRNSEIPEEDQIEVTLITEG